jgi:nucleotide-binding universal stress UspA family protein
MFENVVVLLDGSEVSEIVLRYVSFMTCSAKSGRITLLRVMEGTDEHDREVAEGYLVEKAERLRETWNESHCKMAEVVASLVEGPPGETPETVAGFIDSTKQNMVMLATRGWSGPEWWTNTSVAERIIKDSSVPVFVVRLHGPRRLPPAVRRIMVPVDGSEWAERSVAFARDIGEKASATINLVYVRRQPDRGEAASEVEASEEEITTHLERLSMGLRDSVQTTVTSVNTRGAVSQQIADMAEKEGVDLVVMSSHGRSGPGRGQFGGVTDRVLHACHVPVLVVPHRA